MTSVRCITLDASKWITRLDVYEALLSALGSPDGHGRNINALIDSMVYGHINEIDAPYKIVVTCTKTISPEAASELLDIILTLGEAGGVQEGIEFHTEPMTAKWVPYADRSDP